MTAFIQGSTEAAAFDRAGDITLAIVNARRSGSVDEAAFILEDYFASAMASGLSVPTAWTMLFSASAIWLTEVINDLSAATGVPAEELIERMSLQRAVEMTT